VGTAQTARKVGIPRAGAMGTKKTVAKDDGDIKPKAGLPKTGLPKPTKPTSYKAPLIYDKPKTKPSTAASARTPMPAKSKSIGKHTQLKPLII
jgi:hypothetical protein